MFIVHWNFCNHFRITEEKEKKKKNENGEGQALTYTYIYIQYNIKKEKICRVFFCIIRVQKAQARFVVNVSYTFSLLVYYIIKRRCHRLIDLSHHLCIEDEFFCLFLIIFYSIMLAYIVTHLVFYIV